MISMICWSEPPTWGFPVERSKLDPHWWYNLRSCWEAVCKKTIINQSDKLCLLLTALSLSWFTSLTIYTNYPVPTHVSTGLTLGQHWELRWAKLSSSSNFAGKSSSSLVRLTSNNLVLICYFECLDINQIVAPPHVWTLWWQAKVDTLPTCTLYLFSFYFMCGQVVQLPGFDLFAATVLASLSPLRLVSWFSSNHRNENSFHELCFTNPWSSYNDKNWVVQCFLLVICHCENTWQKARYKIIRMGMKVVIDVNVQCDKYY